MEGPRRQPDYEPSIQSFFSFLDRVSSFEVVNPDPPEDPTRRAFAVLEKVRTYFDENGQEKLNQIITALFPQGDGIFSNDVLPNNISVFCTLLKISKGRWMKHFRHYESLSDARLPFDPTRQPLNWPKDTEDPEFLRKFCEEQWKFFVPLIRQPFVDKHFPKDTILPIVYKKEISAGGSARLWKVKLDPAYNKLVTEDEKERLGDSANLFVLKEYFTISAEKHYDAEVEAFRRLGSNPSIIGFYGSFTRGDTYNVLLEYADKGTLEDYFRKVMPPVDPDETINFWQALFKIIDALRRIHQVNPDGNGGPLIFQGWHQDVKPENILVVSNGSENPRDWHFKLADLGTSHFKRVDTSRQDSSASDSYGTRTYGAPECYRPDAASANDKLRVGRNVDIWSLGCIYSEAARWMKNQYPGILQYRQERSEEICSLPEFRDADCFHNGHEILNAVRESHKMSTKNLRTEDYITKAVVEQMIPDMLDTAEARPTANALWLKSKRIVTSAMRELQRANGSPSSLYVSDRSRLSRSRTVPERGPPAPPNPPPGVSDLERSHQHGNHMLYGSQRGSAHSRTNSNRILTPPLFADEEESQQSHSPDLIADDRGWTEQSSNQWNHMPPANHFPHNDRDTISPTIVSRPLVQRSVIVPQSDISWADTRREHDGVTMNGGSPRGIRNQNLKYNQDYCESPILDQASTNRRSSSPDGMKGLGFVPKRRSAHSRHFSRGESYHSPTSSNNSALSAILGSISRPTTVENSPPTSQREERAQPHESQNNSSNLAPVAPPPQRWSVEEALEWKREKKQGGTQKAIPNAHLYDRLRNRDHVFLIDDSVTMASHWERLTNVFEALSYILKGVDPNGLDLSFTISRDSLTKIKKTSQLLQMVKDRSKSLKGTTDMNLKLTAILEEYQVELQKPKTLFRKSTLRRNFYILTDGIWEPNCDASGPIKSLVNKLNELGRGRIQVGIQFISFGENNEALQRLDKLDSGLGLKPDIVDHERSDGDVWKMLLGSTNDTYDSINEKPQNAVSVKTTGRSLEMNREQN